LKNDRRDNCDAVSSDEVAIRLVDSDSFSAFILHLLSRYSGLFVDERLVHE
jgi:hypothetical protein